MGKTHCYHLARYATKANFYYWILPNHLSNPFIEFIYFANCCSKSVLIGTCQAHSFAVAFAISFLLSSLIRTNNWIFYGFCLYAYVHSHRVRFSYCYFFINILYIVLYIFIHKFFINLILKIINIEKILKMP